MPTQKSTVTIELAHSVLHQETLINHLKVLPSSASTFIKTLITVGLNNKDNSSESVIITREQVQDELKRLGRGSSNPTISRRMTELCELQIASLSSTGGGRKTRSNRYVIKDMSELAARPHSVIENKNNEKKNARRTASIVRQQKDLFSQDPNQIFLNKPEDMSILLHERIFNGILDQAMRLSSKDKRREITAQFNINGHPLTVRSTCSSAESSTIAVLADQRVMRIINSYCKKEISYRKKKLEGIHGETQETDSLIPNLFTIDIYDLCDLMKIRRLSKNIDNVVKIMRRLNDTTFTVDASENEWFRTTFSMARGLGVPQGSDLMEFKYLNNLEIAREDQRVDDMFSGGEITQLKPRFYTFSLEPRLFTMLVKRESEDLFLSHPGLKFERSGIMQRFYNWARGFIGSTNKKHLESKWYSIHETHEMLTSAARVDNFKTYFLRALKSKAAEGEWKDRVEGRALIYGYYVYYERRNGLDMFRFARDKDDELVGDNSKHNQLLRQQILNEMEYLSNHDNRDIPTGFDE